MKFLPYPISAGFVTGTGLALVWSQLGPLIGLEGRLASYDWRSLIDNAKPLAFVVGVFTMVAVSVGPRITQSVQPLLIGLVAGTACYHAVAAFTGASPLGPVVGAISPLGTFESNLVMAWSRVDSAWLLDTSARVLPYSVFLALQQIMNSVTNTVAVADVTGANPDLSRSLVAQGVANMMCGMLAALPITHATSRCAPAAKMAGINTWVPAVSSLVLLVGVLLFGPVIALIPITVLAGMLLTSGRGILDRWSAQLLKRARDKDSDPQVKWNLLIVLAVAGTFFFGNVPMALLVGTVLAIILLMVELSRATKLAAQESALLASRRVWPVGQQTFIDNDRSAIKVFSPRGGLFFATAEQLSEQLKLLGDNVRYCVIDCSRLTVLDANGCQIISSSAKKLAARGITVVLAGLDPATPHDRALIDLGLKNPSPKDRWFRDLDHALEWIEIEILKTHSPNGELDETVPLVRAQLAEGLTTDELDVLKTYLAGSKLESGETLFKRGAPGSSIYIIESGLIEIRIDTDKQAGMWRRMAVLGPGCIFGEVAMLTGGHRSADAVCVKPARLLELKQESLDALKADFPGIHARILANLNRHLAVRLIAATEIARSQ